MQTKLFMKTSHPFGPWMNLHPKSANDVSDKTLCIMEPTKMFWRAKTNHWMDWGGPFVRPRFRTGFLALLLELRLNAFFHRGKNCFIWICCQEKQRLKEEYRTSSKERRCSSTKTFLSAKRKRHINTDRRSNLNPTMARADEAEFQAGTRPWSEERGLHCKTLPANLWHDEAGRGLQRNSCTAPFQAKRGRFFCSRDCCLCTKHQSVQAKRGRTQDLGTRGLIKLFIGSEDPPNDLQLFFCSRDCCLCTKHQSVKELRHAGSKGKTSTEKTTQKQKQNTNRKTTKTKPTATTQTISSWAIDF